MTHDAMPAYGLWGLVIINTAVFVIFAFSFTKPKTSRDWRSFWRLFRLHHRAVHGNVRVPVDDLPAFGLADAHVSGHRSVLARCRASVGGAARPARRSSFQRPAHIEHRRDFRRFHPAVGRVEDAL